MPIEDTKITKLVTTTRELNYFLQSGWKLILAYAKHVGDTNQPHYVVAWQNEEAPIYPELLDEWERHELDANKYR